MSRKLRSYIHEENSRHAKEVKEAKHKVAATKEKVIETKVLCSFYMDYPCCYIVFIIIPCACYVQVKCLEKKLRSEKAKAVPSTVSPYPMEEHEALLSKIRIEVDEAHTEMLGLKGTTQKGMP